MSGYASARVVVAQTLAQAIAPRKPMRVSEWAERHRVLTGKHSPVPGRWRNERNPLLVEIMDCFSARSPVHDVVARLPIQFGKALALDTPIPTPQGWTRMDELSVGDEVLGADGRPARVLAVSPVFHEHPCYRLAFSDGECIVADAGHRWRVIDTAERNEARRARNRRRGADGRSAAHERVLTTAELAATFRYGRQSRYAVPLAQPLELPERVLPLDPYTLGVWLGDGAARSGQLTLHADDAGVIVQRLAAAGHHAEVRPLADRHAVNVLIDGRGRSGETFHARLARLGLQDNKHIPADYLRASRAQRLALLQGLLDTDGHASPRGVVEVVSVHARLAEDIVELARSLGFKPTVRPKPTGKRPAWRITFTAYAGCEVFSVPRKGAVLPPPGARAEDIAGVRFIVDVQQVPSVPTRCIAVDSTDRLFLCGAGMIPTHNSELETNVLGYTMTENPGPIIVALPGEVSMNKFIDGKLSTLIDDTPVVQRVLTSVASRESSNRRSFKDFRGGQLYIEHAGNPTRLKSTPAKVILADEFSSFASHLKSGDDPNALLDGRSSAFPASYKRLKVGTPEILGRCRITELYEKSDQRRWYVPCPACGHRQPLEWSGLHWNPEVTRAWYTCRACEEVFEEHQKPQLIAAGGWVAENPGAAIRGYHANGLYYPVGLGPTWIDLVRMWLDAQGDPAKLKTFINDRLAEPWEDPAMRAVKHNLVADRAEPWPLRPVPHWVLAVTAGIDTQDNRLPVHILGWGRGMTCWPIDYLELPGDPNDDDVWAALVDLLSRPIEHASGALLRVEASAQDMLGHRTEAVKAFVRSRRLRRHIAVFGATANNAPPLGKPRMQEINWRGQYDKHGVHAYPVGTVAIKHMLYGWLSSDADRKPEDRRLRFSDQLGLEYFGGLTSETYNPAKNRFEKKRGGPRNEPLDTWVYAYAAALHPELRLHRWTKADWDRREEQLLASVRRGAPDPRETSGATPAPTAVADSRGTIRRRSSALVGDDWSFS